jgi:hypothetical protein
VKTIVQSEPGQSRTQIVKRLSGKVGRHTVLKVLTNEELFVATDVGNKITYTLRAAEPRGDS